MSRFSQAVNIAEYSNDACQRLLTGIHDVIDTIGDDQREILIRAVEEATMMLNLGLVP